MRFLAIIVGIMLVILVMSGLKSANANAAPDAITVSPQHGSAVKAAVYLSADGKTATYVIVQATGMDPLSTHAFARMDANCATVLQLLNPIMASIAGDGGSTSIATGKPDGTWWFGILSGASAGSKMTACGPAGGTAPSTSTTMPTPTATPNGALVPVHQGTTPPDAPVVNPNATPTPLGS